MMLVVLTMYLIGALINALILMILINAEDWHLRHHRHKAICLTIIFGSFLTWIAVCVWGAVEELYFKDDEDDK